MKAKRGWENFIRSLVFAVSFVWFVGSSAFAAEIVSFKGTTKIASGDFVMLTGKLTKPQGNGPFPAVVLLHGCGGIREDRDVQWVERLVSWGYVALQVDSFKPRGWSSICANLVLMFEMIEQRHQDAYDAKAYLSELPYVDRNRIGVMGWSHGGITILSVVEEKRYDSFRSAIAFYPLCNSSFNQQTILDFNAPLLILIGEKDDWTPASNCSGYSRSGQTGYEIIVKTYPDSYHAFDGKGVDEVITRHRLLYNPVAAGDAIIQVKAFLSKYLK